MPLTRKERKEKIQKLKEWIDANGEKALEDRHCHTCKSFVGDCCVGARCDKGIWLDTRSTDAIGWYDKRLALKRPYPWPTLKKFEVCCLHWEEK